MEEVVIHTIGQPGKIEGMSYNLEGITLQVFHNGSWDLIDNSDIPSEGCASGKDVRVLKYLFQAANLAPHD